MSRIVHAYRGGISIDYLEGVRYWRINELADHAELIGKDIKAATDVK